jgi:hypothetical protein
MPSDLKSETARINGAKSHGPKTAEGKEASSRNAIKHGLTAHTLILQCESPEDYQAMLAEHIAIHQPVTPPENELVDQMAIARWRIRRFVAAETDLIDCEIVRNRDKVEKEFATPDSGVRHGNPFCLPLASKTKIYGTNPPTARPRRLVFTSAPPWGRFPTCPVHPKAEIRMILTAERYTNVC